MLIIRTKKSAKHQAATSALGSFVQFRDAFEAQRAMGHHALAAADRKRKLNLPFTPAGSALHAVLDFTNDTMGFGTGFGAYGGYGPANIFTNFERAASEDRPKEVLGDKKGEGEGEGEGHGEEEDADGGENLGVAKDDQQEAQHPPP